MKFFQKKTLPIVLSMMGVTSLLGILTSILTGVLICVSTAPAHAGKAVHMPGAYESSDEGKPCSDSDQCEGVCVSILDPHLEAAMEDAFSVRYFGESVLRGTCSKRIYPSECLYEVRGGRQAGLSCKSVD